MVIVAVIPAYNKTAFVTLAAIIDAKKYVDHVVVIDDCSTDDTSSMNPMEGVTILHHVINRGQGAALQTGTEYALRKLGADVIVHFDADGQMQGREIPMMIKPIIDGTHDIVIGSRFLGREAMNMPVFRKIMIKLGTIFTIALSGIKVTDTHNGFRALSKYAASEIKISLDRMAHASEIIDLIKTKRLRYIEQPVTILYTDETLKKGQSTLHALLTVKDIMKKKIFG